jgi:hypothetical protein
MYQVEQQISADAVTNGYDLDPNLSLSRGQAVVMDGI